MSDTKKKMMVSDITHTIYYGRVKDVGNGIYQSVGKREDVTDEAIKAVFEWFMKEYERDGINSISYTNFPYEMRFVKLDEPVQDENES